MHPWRLLRSMEDWTLVWRPLPIPALGLCDWMTKTITLDPRLRQAERRCTVLHEIQHAHRQIAPDDPVLRAREELAVDRIVARALIEVYALGEALAWAHALTEVAEELWVDEATLTVRLTYLHPAERSYLRRRLDRIQPTA